MQIYHKLLFEQHVYHFFHQPPPSCRVATEHVLQGWEGVIAPALLRPSHQLARLPPAGEENHSTNVEKIYLLAQRLRTDKLPILC